MSELLDFDPPKEKRRYFRHVRTGDLAYLVKRGGLDHIKYDRPFDTTTMLFREADWKEELHAEPMAPAQAVQVSFAAVKALKRFMGQPMKAKQEWANLTDKERSNWLGNGPIHDPPPCKALHDAIMKVLEPFTRPT